MKAENRHHFGVPILEIELPDVRSRQAEIRQCLENMRREDEGGIQRSNQRGWHSADNLHQSSEPVFQWLTEQIFQIGKRLILHAERKPAESEIFLSSLWANINDFGAWNAPHAHLPCEWSGCLYIDVDENPQEENAGICPGDILFFDPIPVGAPYRPAPTVSYTPKVGTMYVFPGYLLHMVAPHYNEQPRISLAFNFRLGENLTQIAR